MDAFRAVDFYRYVYLSEGVATMPSQPLKTGTNERIQGILLLVLCFSAGALTLLLNDLPGLGLFLPLLSSLFCVVSGVFFIRYFASLYSRPIRMLAQVVVVLALGYFVVYLLISFGLLYLVFGPGAVGF
jgi:hypothetical protein